MLKKRIIPCLDVKDGNVVKGVQFRNHQIVGDIIQLAINYSQVGADELVFYDITASSDKRSVYKTWVTEVARNINIPFCVAGGIRTIQEAEIILANGADKISINSPALENPQIINDFAKRFGSQCIVVGIDSYQNDIGQYQVRKYTGDVSQTQTTSRFMLEWALEAQERGAGEIVLNCINQDGIRQGYDLLQTKLLSEAVSIPIIASGGAGTMEHFKQIFENTKISGALAASVFHKQLIAIEELKHYLNANGIEVRL